METESILIANSHSTHNEIIDLLKRRIEGYITATKYVMIMYNVSKALLAEAVKVTPGKRSPTITNLDDENFKAVSSLVKKSELSSKMDELYELGATDILALTLSNSRM